MARVLIVEDSPTQAQHLQFLLEDAGYQVDTAANGRDAIDIMERDPPDIIVTDLEMPKMNGIQLVETVRERFSDIPVVLMTAFGSEEVAALALQKGASSYVPKRYLIQDILPTLANLLVLAQTIRHSQRVLEIMTKAEYEFVLNSDRALIPPLIGFLEEMVQHMALCDKTGLIRVCVALREALVNAIDHGNLEVESETREEANGSYMHLIEERRRAEPYRNRRVYVSAKITPMKAEFVIRDEGRGFDPASLPDPRDPANLEKLSGRGLLLIRTFMDQVYHNEAGNEITLVKRCDLRRTVTAI
jgi:CheY-like chemotaxis protein/anti-sigma regulatory factor (Ser/Thr protein kinase)